MNSDYFLSPVVFLPVFNYSTEVTFCNFAVVLDTDIFILFRTVDLKLLVTLFGDFTRTDIFFVAEDSPMCLVCTEKG